MTFSRFSLRFPLLAAWPLFGLAHLLLILSTSCACRATELGVVDCLNSNPFQTTLAFDHMDKLTIQFINDQGIKSDFEVKVADEPMEQTAGFQCIGEKVIEQSLILFIFDEEAQRQFHMRNVRAPLDIAFIAGDGKILEIITMDPDPLVAKGLYRLYGARAPFRYALEARKGFFAAHQFFPGKTAMMLSPDGESPLQTGQ